MRKHPSRKHAISCGAAALVLLGSLIIPVRADLRDELREAASAVAAHPRLFMKPGDAEALRERVREDGIARAVADLVLAKAGRALDAEPVKREMRGRRLLSVSREALDRLSSLSMAWLLTEDRRFVTRAEAEMRAIAAFPDWNPSHFLDVAEMTLALAIACDWLHDELDPDVRAVARAAILENGLSPALASDTHWWMTTTNNWNQVCHGGLVAGALVVLEDAPEAALKIIERAVRHLPEAMGEYAPSGGYPEGPGYWSYGTSYNVVLLAALESALGGTFGLDEKPGFNKTGEFPFLMTGPSGLMFNFSDGGAGRRAQPAIYWLARHYGQPGWAAREDGLLMEPAKRSARGTDHWMPAFTLLWREPPGGVATRDLPAHWTSDNSVPVSVHRENWSDADAVFFGIKAGSPSASHGQMDIGSFVLDANGVRWAHDLGAENYTQVEATGIRMWDKGQNSDRWRVFRNTNHSHNTLVIDGALQQANANAEILRFSDDPAFPHSVVDMSAGYAGQLSRAHRGMALLPDGTVVVRDSLHGLRSGAEVRWGMVTRADAEGTGAAMNLRQDGHGMELAILGREDSRWEVAELANPTNAWDSPNPGMRLIHFTTIAPESGSLELTVVIHPKNRARGRLPEKISAQPLKWSPPRG